MAVAEDVGLVRSVWVAARDNDVETLVALTAPDVDWRPTAVTAGALHGHDALRDYLDGLAEAAHWSTPTPIRSRRWATASSSAER